MGSLIVKVVPPEGEVDAFDMEFDDNDTDFEPLFPGYTEKALSLSTKFSEYTMRKKQPKKVSLVKKPKRPARPKKVSLVKKAKPLTVAERRQKDRARWAANSEKINARRAQRRKERRMSEHTAEPPKPVMSKTEKNRRRQQARRDRDHAKYCAQKKAVKDRMAVKRLQSLGVDVTLETLPEVRRQRKIENARASTAKARANKSIK